MHFLNLSERQQEILRFIVDFVHLHHYAPTIRQIGETVAISSTSVVKYNLNKLQEYGLILRERDISRGLSVNWEQLQQSGYPYALNGESVRGRQREERLPEADVERLRVPLLGKIAAGSPIAVTPSEVYDPEGWIELAAGMVAGPADKLFALRVQGDSMIDASVLDGDIVILRHQETAHDGDMVAAWIEGDEETTLKYLHRDGAFVRLVPANPNPVYQPIVRAAEQVRINGKVVSVIRVLK
ncbi:MAG: transcriptional repressor LexA [Chloroflexi bacterium]|nr:transcriptional repressor LexA [Chloroflexota bacterium]